MNDFNQFLPRCYYEAPIVRISVKLNYRYLAGTVLNAPAMLCIQAMLLRWVQLCRERHGCVMLGNEDLVKNIFYLIFQEKREICIEK